jgi:hypothetical protein
MTTIHNPAHLDFDPAAYRCEGVFDLHPEEGDRGVRSQVVSRLVDKGYRFDGIGGGVCAHCGNRRIRYAALMSRVLPDGRKVLVDIGETCLDNRFSLDKGEFQALRKAARLNSERRAVRAQYADLVASHAWIAWALDADLPAIAGATRRWSDVEILGDLLDKARRYGSLSDKQHAFGARLVERLQESVERIAERKAEAEALAAAGVRAPEGRVEVMGEVVSLKQVESDFGLTTKFLVRADEGWKVWGTVPRAILDEVERGSRVAFTATLKPSGDDPTFGFASRPSKARVLATA